MSKSEVEKVHSSIKTFILDDEVYVLEWLIKWVEWGAYNCEIIGSAANAEEAMQFLCTNHVDLLITDISMEGMSGLELIRVIKKIKPNMSVIIISAYSKFEYVKEAVRYGIINYLLKPIDICELNECLKIVEMEYRCRLNGIYTNDVLMFRNGILHELLTGGMDLRKLQEQCKLIGLDLESSHYQISVLDVEEVPNKIYSSLVAYFNSNVEEGVYCFSGSRKYIVLIFVGNDISTQKSKNIIEQAIRKDKVRDLFYCIGKVLSDYEKIQESYRFCCDFISAKWVFSGRTICIEDYPYEDYTSTGNNLFIRQLANVIYLEDVKNIIRIIEKKIDEFKFENDKKNNLICIIIFLIKTFRLKHVTQKITTPMWKIECLKSEEILEYINNYCKDLFDNQRRNNEKIQTYEERAILEVSINYCNRDLSLQKVADICGISSAYLGQLFYMRTGEYFNEYLLRKRLEVAENYLLESHRSIGEIATLTGFSGQSYFNKMFRKFYGVSPMEYRKRSKIGECLS